MPRLLHAERADVKAALRIVAMRRNHGGADAVSLGLLRCGSL
jgi:hypothetical protein